MTAHSGKFSRVNGQTTTRGWNVNDVMVPAKYIASNTKMGTGAKDGIQSWQGSFGQFGGFPTVMPGELFTFQGYTAPDNDVLGGTGTVYSGQAIVDQLQVNFNWQTGEVLNLMTNFSGHLALAKLDDQAAIEDNTTPDVPSVCCARFDVGAALDAGNCSSGSGAGESGDGDEEWENLASATLTITAANVPFVNSSTDCWTGRRSGNIDWALSVVEQATKRRSGIYQKIRKGRSVELKLYIDTARFWWLKWGKVHDFSNVVANTETGEIISRTVAITMDGFPNGVAGLIRLPGAGSNYWPAV